MNPAIIEYRSAYHAEHEFASGRFDRVVALLAGHVETVPTLQVGRWKSWPARLTRTLGPDHPDTLTSRNNLAIVYDYAGRIDDAVTLFECTLADRERILGPDHPDTLISRHNLTAARRRRRRRRRWRRARIIGRWQRSS